MLDMRVIERWQQQQDDELLYEPLRHGQPERRRVTVEAGVDLFRHPLALPLAVDPIAPLSSQMCETLYPERSCRCGQYLLEWSEDYGPHSHAADHPA